MDHLYYSKGVEADYERIYPDDAVQRLDIVIDGDLYGDAREHD